jgi:hypothetical protein
VIANIVKKVIMVNAVTIVVQNVVCKMIVLSMDIVYNALVDFMVNDVKKHVPHSVKNVRTRHSVIHA